MKSLRNLGTLALAAVFGAALFAGTADSQEKFTPARIAFVDLVEVFKQAKEWNRIQTETRDKVRTMDDGLREQFEKLKKLEEEFELAEPGTDRHRNMNRELERGKLLLKFEQDSKQREIESAALVEMNRFYRRIHTEAANFAQRNGIQTIFLKGAPDLDARSIDELKAMIASRPVLYSQDSLDVTKPVIELLNK